MESWFTVAENKYSVIPVSLAYEQIDALHRSARRVRTL